MKEIARIELPKKVTYRFRKTKTDLMCTMSKNKVDSLNRHDKNTAKKDYARQLNDVLSEIKRQRKFKKIVIESFSGEGTNYDLDNLCTHFKFLQDAIVEKGILKDDNVKFIPSIGVEYMGKRKKKTCEAVIYV